jgi:hypothetical protein
MTKSALSLIPLIGDDAKFREQLVLLPVWEQVRPKPWGHNRFPLTKGGSFCIKCAGKFSNGLISVGCCPIPDPFTGSLAELAFELRDKACKLSVDKNGISPLDRAKIEVWKTCCVFAGNMAVKHQAFFSQMLIAADSWFSDRAKPEHWILAALYALELAGKGKEDE